MPFSVTGYNSFDEMYRSERNLVYRIVLCRVRERAAAEELTQDTFLRVFQKWDSYVPQDQKDLKESFSSWLRTIAKNLAINYLVGIKRRQAYASGIQANHATKDIDEYFVPNQHEKIFRKAALSYTVQKSPTPEELVIQKQMIESIDEILEGSPYLETAKLALMEGLAYKEIAALQGIPIGTVMSGLNRARQKLKQSQKFL